MIRAPYVPTLGPVHPQALSVELFDAVVSVAHSGRFLPYDKDCRWSGKKDERVITAEINHTPELTVIPTLSTRGRETLKIYHYAQDPPDLDQVSEWAHKWCATYSAQLARVIWLQDNPNDARGRLMLKTYAPADQHHDSPHVTELHHCDVADTFGAFAEELEADGFTFLHQRLKAGRTDGPILVAVDGQRIAGALGPLSTMIDATGTLTVPPQYFAVHPNYRQKGHGRALWQAATAWGHHSGATYKVLQAETGAPSERLYLSEGLSSLGFVREKTINHR